MIIKYCVLITHGVDRRVLALFDFEQKNKCPLQQCGDAAINTQHYSNFIFFLHGMIEKLLSF